MALGALRAPSAILSGGGARARRLHDPLGGPAGLWLGRPKKSVPDSPRQFVSPSEIFVPTKCLGEEGFGSEAKCGLFAKIEMKTECGSASHVMNQVIKCPKTIFVRVVM